MYTKVNSQVPLIIKQHGINWNNVGMISIKEPNITQITKKDEINCTQLHCSETDLNNNCHIESLAALNASYTVHRVIESRKRWT